MTQVAEVKPIVLLNPAPISPSPAQFSAKPPVDAGSEEGMVRQGLPGDSQPPDEAKQVASIQPRIGTAGESVGDDASRPTGAAQQVPAAVVLLTAPIYHKTRGAQHGSAHRRASGTSVRPYVTQSVSHGTWLSAPNSNEGANN
jgi:hypothetical protein